MVSVEALHLLSCDENIHNDYTKQVQRKKLMKCFEVKNLVMEKAVLQVKYFCQDIVQQCVEFINPFLMIFLDYENAFDCPQTNIVEVLTSQGIPINYVKLIEMIK